MLILSIKQCPRFGTMRPGGRRWHMSLHRFEARVAPPETYVLSDSGGAATPEMDFFADQGDAFPLIPLDKGFWWERGKGVRDIID